MSASRITGKERDAESGNDYFAARHYSSAAARFMQTDPVLVWITKIIDPQQLNLYAYARNSPLKFVDLTGQLVRLAPGMSSADQHMLVSLLAHAYQRAGFRAAFGQLAISKQMFLWKSESRPGAVGDAKTDFITKSGKVVESKTVTTMTLNRAETDPHHPVSALGIEHASHEAYHGVQQAEHPQERYEDAYRNATTGRASSPESDEEETKAIEFGDATTQQQDSMSYQDAYNKVVQLLNLANEGNKSQTPSATPKLNDDVITGFRWVY